MTSVTAVDIPAANPRIATGAWRDVLSQPHPRLLGPTGFVQERAAKYPGLYAEIARLDSLLARGIAHAVEGVPDDEAHAIVRAALAEIERGATNVHQDTWIWLQTVTLAYDLFHETVTPPDRDRAISWINPHLETYLDDECAFHNSTPTKMLVYLQIACATWVENPRAQEFRDYAIDRLYEQLLAPVLRTFGQGGGWTECGWYQRHGVWHLVQALELARRVFGYDGYSRAPRFFYQRLAYEMHQPYPAVRADGTERFAHEGDGGGHYSQNCEYPHLTRDVIAEYYRGSELSRYAANRPRWSRHPRTLADELLYRPEQDEYPLPIEQFPLSHLASGVGKLYARSDWTQDATWLRFECGDYFVQHQHLEVGNFEIFRREPLATESGHYDDWTGRHVVNWYLRTIAHNCILVEMPGEDSWRELRLPVETATANDGGQAKKWRGPVWDLDAWMADRESRTRGRIVAYQNEPEFLYVAGDCTAAYSSEKLECWIRQILFLRPSTFVIFDRVIATREEYRKRWLLHCHEEPELEGETFVIRNGEGVLHAQRLLPRHAQVRAIEGYEYGGESFPPRKGRAEPGNPWRIEVAPGPPAREDRFLYVLSTGRPEAATLMPETEGVGARIGEYQAIFEARVGGRLQIGDRSFLLAAAVRVGPYE